MSEPKKSKEEIEALKAATAAEMHRRKEELLDALESIGYDAVSVIELLHDEVIEYAENEGYHYCDNCDERMGDPDDGSWRD